MDILLITGPAGVGKSTLSWALSARLASLDIAHAVIESDELDRVHPKPAAEQLERLRPGAADISSLNLAALWSTYSALGHSRLIMSGVMLHLAFDRRWILNAIPDARLTVVRLTAAEPALLARLARREAGADADAQVERSLRQARRLASLAEGDVLHLSTDGRSPAELAEVLIERVDWLTQTQA